MSIQSDFQYFRKTNKFFAAPKPPGNTIASNSVDVRLAKGATFPRAMRADSTRTFLLNEMRGNGYVNGMPNYDIKIYLPDFVCGFTFSVINHMHLVDVWRKHAHISTLST